MQVQGPHASAHGSHCCHFRQRATSSSSPCPPPSTCGLGSRIASLPTLAPPMRPAAKLSAVRGTSHSPQSASGQERLVQHCQFAGHHSFCPCFITPLIRLQHPLGLPLATPSHGNPTAPGSQWHFRGVGMAFAWEVCVLVDLLSLVAVGTHGNPAWEHACWRCLISHVAVQGVVVKPV